MQKETKIINKLTSNFVQSLLVEQEAPCISIYLTTHKKHPENLQDGIKFKLLIKQVEHSLSLKYSNADVNKHVEQLVQLVDDTNFWQHTNNGLAIFSANNFFEIVLLNSPLEDFAIVADSFHTKPLRQYLQSTDYYQVLGISQKSIRLFEGNKHSLTEVDIKKHVSTTIEEALGYELTEKHQTVASYGGTNISMSHGHGGKKDEQESDTQRFFRYVSNEIYENFSKYRGLPLILAALAEHQSIFKEVNKNPYLVSECVSINPLDVDLDKLKDMAWKVMEPIYIGKTDAIVEKFLQKKSDNLANDDIKEVAKAILEGRIETLLVEDDRIIASRLTNMTTGNIQNKDINNPMVDDLLDDLSELVIKKGGEVIMISKEKMPSTTGLAAIYRY
jgi:hypothetical protein